MKLTAHQLEILQHALGVDRHGKGEITRNIFCAGGDDEDTCRQLVAIGYMTSFRRSWLPYYNCRVTGPGIQAMHEQSPPPPRLTRGQMNYRAFMRADTGESFREWLTRETA